jgi:hypothetical protein
MAGAASNGGRPVIRTDSPAARAHLLAQTAPQAAIAVDHEDPAPRIVHDEQDTEPPRRRWPIVTSLFALLLVVVIGGLYLGWRYTQDQYYVGTNGGQVVIFQGINQSVAGINLSHVHQRTGIPVGVPSRFIDDQATTSPATWPLHDRRGEHPGLPGLPEATRCASTPPGTTNTTALHNYQELQERQGAADGQRQDSRHAAKFTMSSRQSRLAAPGPGS